MQTTPMTRDHHCENDVALRTSVIQHDIPAFHIDLHAGLPA